ncbi:hypothetical protein F8A10_01130 [Paracoccus kondratievae]|uniref:hypothetical protein n=1 Tax=Paracoccus TaxID=265 RepID=UPI000A0C3EFB|nr:MULTISPECIES: hypothetical protein [Paracoccus]QFQ86141.1 hypothetical protein F8A10_01130 [Paracoccus kondratievae]SMG51318.1 hypothetical protein SAMN02746000_03212 [Paracoccus sp. J56]
MPFTAIINSVSSLLFILLVAHTTAYQEANWPAGRVVHVREWVVYAAYALGAVLLWLTVFPLKDQQRRAALAAWYPWACWALLIVGVVIMPMFFPTR